MSLKIIQGCQALISWNEHIIAADKTGGCSRFQPYSSQVYTQCMCWGGGVCYSRVLWMELAPHEVPLNWLQFQWAFSVHYLQDKNQCVLCFLGPCITWTSWALHFAHAGRGHISLPRPPPHCATLQQAQTLPHPPPPTIFHFHSIVCWRMCGFSRSGSSHRVIDVNFAK